MENAGKNTQHRKILHALHLMHAVSLATLHRLIRIFTTPERVWRCNEKELIAASHMRSTTARSLVAQRQKIDIDKEWGTLEKILSANEGFTVTTDDPYYPLLLREIPQPPLLLYCRGERLLLQHPALFAIVGSRRATSYGRRVVKETVAAIVQRHIVTVSGLAFGIDRMVHEATLDNGGATIAVLGSSVCDDDIYPQSHVPIARRMLKNRSLILSEYPPGTKARAHFFPERNRIIAGLADSTLVVEAAEKSGSLITAHFALETNRDVYAVPGPITSSLSAGTNRLIAQGAAPWLSCAPLANTIEYDQPITSNDHVVALTPEEQTLCYLIATEAKTVDAIVAESNLPAATILQQLSMLELRGIIVKEDALRYRYNQRP